MGWGLVLGEWYLPILWTTLVPSRAFFRFFASCTGAEEIELQSTRGKRRKKNNNEKKKNRQKKKKSGNLMKRAQQNFERDPRKNNILRAKPYAVRKQKFTNKVRELTSILFEVTLSRQKHMWALKALRGHPDAKANLQGIDTETWYWFRDDCSQGDRSWDDRSYQYRL